MFHEVVCSGGLKVRYIAQDGSEMAKEMAGQYAKFHKMMSSSDKDICSSE